MYVYSTTHRRNFGKPFVAHIGVRERRGINHMPVCGWRASGPTGTSAALPSGMKICPKCLSRVSEVPGR
jgi:hypothetical protein